MQRIFARIVFAACLACGTLSASAILDYPDLDLTEMYQSVRVGGEYRRSLRLSFLAPTNYIAQSVYDMLAQAKRDALARNTASLPGYFDSLIERTFTFDQSKIDMLMELTRPSRASEDEQRIGGGQQITIDPERDVHINVRGELNTRISWGAAKQLFVSDDFLKSEHQTNSSAGNWRWNDAAPGGINYNWQFSQNLFVSLLGTVANQLKIQIDHVSGRDENAYGIEWQPGDKTPVKKSRSIIQRIQVGDVDMALGGGSTFISLGGINRKAFGIRAEFERDNFTANLILSLSKGLVATYSSVGNSELIVRTNWDYEYLRRRFFNLGKRNIATYAIYRLGAGAPKLVINGKGFEEFQGEFVDRERGIIDFGSARESDTLVIFFTYYSNGIATKMPTTNEIIDGITYPYDRSDTNYRYTDMTNMNIAITNASTGLPVDTANPLFASSNFIVLIDQQEAGPNPFELRNSYSMESSIDETTLEISLFKNDLEVPGEQKHAIDRRGTFKTTGPFTIDLDKSRIVFDSNRPYSLNEALYTNQTGKTTDPYIPKANSYNLHIKYYRKSSGSAINLMPNMIEGSETVKINSVAVPKTEYTVDYAGGIVRFVNPNRVGKTDKVDITYEYKPFGSSLQNTLFGARVHYTFGDENQLGVTFLNSGGQKPTGAPSPDTAPSSRAVLGADGRFNLMKLLGYNQSPFVLTAGGEIAYSWYDINTVDKGLILDMEGDEDSLEMRETETGDLYYTYNPKIELKSGVTTNALGELYYIDMHKHDGFGGRTWRDLTYSTLEIMKTNPGGFLEVSPIGQFKTFNTKPGPYMAGNEGAQDPRLYADQRAIVYDYAFDTNKRANYVSVVQGFSTSSSGITNARGIDTSKYNEIEIVAKLVAPLSNSADPQKVYLMLELGNPTEDFDNNLNRSFEQNENATGMDFNYANISRNVNRSTRQGGGYGTPGSASNVIDNGNGRIDVEDLNGDGQFSIDDDVIAFPSSATVTISTNITNTAAYDDITNTRIEFPSYATFTNNSNRYTYQNTFYSITAMSLFSNASDGMKGVPYLRLKMRIRPDISANTRSVLERTKGLRFSIMHADGTPAAGRLIVDRVKFSASRWTEVFVDGFYPKTSDQFKTSIMNSRNDPEYRFGSGNRLIDDKDWARTYTDLHGTLSKDEREKLSESILKIEYSLNNISNTNSALSTDGVKGELVINNSVNRFYDLSIYKELTFFVYRERWSGGNEALLFRFGEATNRCYSIRIPMSLLNREKSATGTTDIKTGWNKVTVKLMEAGVGNNVFKVQVNGGDVTGATVTRIGNATLTRIAMFAFGVDSSAGIPGTPLSGAIWINDTFSDLDVMAEGWAWRADATIAYNAPISIGDIPIITSVAATYAHNDQRKGFGSIGQGLNRSDNASDTFSFRTALFKMLNADISLAQSDTLSDTNPQIIPKDTQTYGLNRSGNFGLSFNSGLPYVPVISHNYSETVSKGFSAVRVESSNTTAIKLVKSESHGRTYGINESLTINNLFGINGASITENYTMSASIQKTVQQETNNVNEQSLSFDRDGQYSRVVGYFYDGDNVFNSDLRKNDIADFRDVVSAKYIFSQNQSGSLSLGMPWFSLGLTLSHGLNQYTDYASSIRNAISDLFERDYFTQFATLWSPNLLDIPVDEVVIITNSPSNYTTNHITRRRSIMSSESYSSGQTLTVPPVPFLGAITFGVNESYSESGYQYDSSKKYSRLTNAFTNIAEFISNFAVYGYNASNAYKNATLSLSANLAFALNFKDIWKECPLQSIPLSFTRTIAASENMIPAGKFSFGTNTYDFNVLRYAGTVIPSLFMPPWYYIDYPFAPVVRALFAGTNAPNAQQRHNASKAVSEMLSYYDWRTQRYTVPYANDEYSAVAGLNETYSITFQFVELPVVKLFLPSSFAWSMSLATARDTLGKISQSDTYSISLGRGISIIDIIKLIHPPFEDPFLRSTSLNYSFAYGLNNNYNTKLQSETFNGSLYFSFRVLNNLPLNINCTYQGTKKLQYLRYNTAGTPYMGIGYRGTITNAATQQYYLLYNIGDNEYGFDFSRDSGIAAIDPGKTEHTFAIDASLTFPQMSDEILFFKLEKAITLNHTIHVAMPYFRFASYDDTVMFAQTGNIKADVTSAKYIDLTGNQVDASIDFLQLVAEYRVGFSLNEYITINEYNKIPLFFRQYYRTSKELADKNKWEMMAGIEIGADVTLRF
ncbi:MAG: hypothetical protein HZC28_08030 [Spirochaetes bacterium]|nr:hypothetical protein [Spirochaetota bacterium]